MVNKPFIYTLKTPLGYYFFDVNKNQIKEIDEKTYRYLENACGVVDSDVEKSLADLKSHGYLSDNRPSKMQHPENEFLEFHLDENIAQLTLQVTQDCNFQCSYCYYAGGSFDNHRSHSSRRMTLEMAITCVDFFVEHSKSQEEVSIGFYGGEPLLEFELIKNVVYYAEEMFEGKNLSFTITTNGSVFNDENINFLSKHNFNVMVSIDGTPEIHNKSRKFADTGEGTYHVIEKNLKKIKLESPDFFEKIMFNVVIDPRNGYDELHEMFSSNELFTGANIRAGIMDDFYAIEKAVESDEYSIESKMMEFKTKLSLLGRYPESKVYGILKTNLMQSIGRHERILKESGNLPDVMSHGGPCIPGQQRLLVTVSGNFIPCERVDETSSAMIVGDIYNGFDYEKARNLLNIAQLTEQSCIDCWAIRNCTLCIRYCDNNGELSSELKKSHCKDTKFSIEEDFRDFLMFKELKYNS